MQYFLIVLICIVFCGHASPSPSQHNNWAVIVSTSRYWFNYRHQANALSMYHVVKSMGIPDSQIILMIPDDVACNPRNIYPAQVYHKLGASAGKNRNGQRQFPSSSSSTDRINLYDETVQVDYRGEDVNVENFIRLLTARHDSSVPRSKRLNTDADSNIFVYMTGHGGDEFIKFNDMEEISSQDLADAFEQMHKQERYKQLFFMVDTCQAGTLSNQFYSPNIIAVGSSALGENSYSHHTDPNIGVSIIDRFTYYTLAYFEESSSRRRRQIAKSSIHDLLASYRPPLLRSTPQIRADLFTRPLAQVPVTDFFGAINSPTLTPFRYPLTTKNHNTHNLSDSRDTTSINIENGGKHPVPHFSTSKSTKQNEFGGDWTQCHWYNHQNNNNNDNNINNYHDNSDSQLPFGTKLNYTAEIFLFAYITSVLGGSAILFDRFISQFI